MAKYFKNINTLEELRSQYRDSLKKHHPDNGVNEEIMKEINAEYNKLFKMLKDWHESKTADSSNTKQSECNSNIYPGK